MSAELITICIACGTFALSVVALFVAVLRASANLTEQITKTATEVAGLRRDLDRHEERDEQQWSDHWTAHEGLLLLVNGNATQVALAAQAVADLAATVARLHPQK